jgi:hypothetical protein
VPSFRISILAASGSLFTFFVQLYIHTSHGNSPETTLLANLTYLISGINLSVRKSLKRWPNRQRLAPALGPPRNGFSAAEAGRAQDISIGFLQFEFGPWANNIRFWPTKCLGARARVEIMPFSAELYPRTDSCASEGGGVLLRRSSTGQPSPHQQ